MTKSEGESIAMRVSLVDLMVHYLAVHQSIVNVYCSDIQEHSV